MFNGSSHEAPERVGFLIVPQFSMMAFFSAVEPLRIANRLSGRELYSWHIFSCDGAPVEASNGMTVMAEAAMAAVERFPVVFVCASFDPQLYESKALLNCLRRARHLLEQTDMSVLQVAMACGFVSAPYFSRAYRGLFQRSPREDRRFLRASRGRPLQSLDLTEAGLAPE